MFIIFNNMKWEVMTKERTYIGSKKNKNHLKERTKLRKQILERTEPTEESVGHNKVVSDFELSS